MRIADILLPAVCLAGVIFLHAEEIDGTPVELFWFAREGISQVTAIKVNLPRSEGEMPCRVWAFDDHLSAAFITREEKDVQKRFSYSRSLHAFLETTKLYPHAVNAFVDCDIQRKTYIVTAKSSLFLARPNGLDDVLAITPMPRDGRITIVGYKRNQPGYDVATFDVKSKTICSHLKLFPRYYVFGPSGTLAWVNENILALVEFPSRQGGGCVIIIDTRAQKVFPENGRKSGGAAVWIDKGKVFALQDNENDPRPKVLFDSATGKYAPVAPGASP